MSAFDRFEQWIFWFVTAVASAVAAGGWWLIRQVFTNQQQIALMQADLTRRDKAREEDRERMQRIEEGIDQITGALLEDRK